MAKTRILYVLPLILLLGASCKEKNTGGLDTEKIRFTKEAELKIFKADSSTISLEIELAETDYERETGLMYREAMAQNQGMLFLQKTQRVQNFYMKNTQIPLDIIYIDDRFKIVSFQKNTRPFSETSLSSRVPAKYVLEINAGLSDQWNLAVGDSISYKKP